jgi:hypothetical protein
VAMPRRCADRRVLWCVAIVRRYVRAVQLLRQAGARALLLLLLHDRANDQHIMLINH